MPIHLDVLLNLEERRLRSDAKRLASDLERLGADAGDRFSTALERNLTVDGKTPHDRPRETSPVRVPAHGNIHRKDVGRFACARGLSQKRYGTPLTGKQPAAMFEDREIRPGGRCKVSSC
jgi:hypothetical protein